MNAVQDRFGELLRHYRQQAQLSQLALARRSGIHASMINRFERAERQPADRAIVERFAQALSLPAADRDSLLAAAGFLPAALERLGAADPELLMIAEVLADPTLPGDERQELRTLLRIVAGRWRRPLPPPL